MKKLKLLFVIFLFIAFNHISKAQKFSIGPDVGFNIQSIETGFLGNSYVLSPNLGVRFNYHINDRISVGTGLIYTQMQQKYFFSETTPITEEFAFLFDLIGGGIDLDELLGEGINLDVNKNTEGRMKNSFLRVPIVAIVHLGDFEISAGGYAGLLMSSNRNEITVTNIPLFQTIDLAEFLDIGPLGALLPPATSEESDSFSSTSGLQSLDFGLNFGLDYCLDNYRVGISYNYGLIDYRSPTEKPVARYSNFGIRLAYLFSL